MQACILLAVAAGLPSKALVLLRAAMSRLADRAPVSSTGCSHPPQQRSPLHSEPHSQQPRTTVAASYLKILGRVAHVLLIYPVRTLSSKILLDSPGEELGVPGWLRLLVSGQARAGRPVTPLRSVDLQRVLSFFALRSHTDLTTAVPRLFALSSSAFAAKNGGDTGEGGAFCEAEEAGNWRVGYGVLESGEGLMKAFEYGDGSRDLAGHDDSVRRSSGSVAEQSLMWMVTEAARLLIRSKLRSSFGGPVQTFEALEHMLLEACTRAEMDGHLLERERDTNGGGGAGGAHANALAQKWHRSLRMLLLFVGHLERLVFSAYEGSTVLPACRCQLE